MLERDIKIHELYQNVINDQFVQKSLADLGLRCRNRIFNCALTTWLMIFQRLDANNTLSAIVGRLKAGEFDGPLMKKSGTSISGNTGSYSEARSRVPLPFVELAADRINEALIAQHKDKTSNGFKVFAIDGSSCTLEGTSDIKEAYPPCRNQSGESAWSKIRTLHAHDVITGVALRPVYGPMHGSKAVGEISLLPSLLERLPAESVVIADRIFGCFQVAVKLSKGGFGCLLRMNDDRAGKFLKELKTPGDCPVTWIPSEHEKKKHPELAQESIKGRFIWFRLKRKGYPDQDFYFFTTIELPPQELMELYLKRWTIETDLFALKKTMELSRITSKSQDMVAKEIILGHVAYNLVRHVMAVAAQLAKIDPRRLSVSRSIDSIRAHASHFLTDSPSQAKKRALNLLSDIQAAKLPNRKNRDAEPRKKRIQRNKYPQLVLPRGLEKELIKSKYLHA